MQNIFSSAQAYSGAFGTAVNQLSGATPDYKVFLFEQSAIVDTLADWNLGTLNGISAGTLGTFGTNGNISTTPSGTSYGTASARGTGYALGFDGTNDFVSCGEYTGLNPAQLTIECWCSCNNIASTPYVVGRGSNSGYELGINAGQFIFLFGGVQLVQAFNILANTIYHVVANYDGTNLKLFVNGTCQGTAASAAHSSPASSFNIGKRDYGPVYWGGTIDSVRLYNVALTGTQIWQRWNNNTKITSGLIAQWELDEGSGSIAIDSAGTFNGTISGAVYGTGYGTRVLGDIFVTGTVDGTIGTYTSKIFNANLYSNYKQLNWSSILNAGTLLAQFHTGSSTADCDATVWTTIVSGTRPNITDNQYYQFRMILSGDGTTTPVVDWFSGTYLYNASDDANSGLQGFGGINKSLERLFNQTEISAISLTVDNETGFWSPYGTNGIYSAVVPYNKQIEIWKGFKYGWDGTTWGTAEYIPAFRGYVDNIACTDNGLAVINCRDKGKLLKSRTSEAVTTTGTAGGAYWTGKRIDQLVEKELVQGANYGTPITDYEIDKTFIVDRLGAYHFVEQEFQKIGTSVAGQAVTFLKGTFFMVDYNNVYSYIPQGTTKYEFSTTTEGYNILNDGTRVYVPDGNETKIWNNGTTSVVEKFVGNAVYYNGFIYTGTQKNAGTVLLHKYNVTSGVFGTCNNTANLAVSNLQLDTNNGRVLILENNAVGTINFTVYTIASDTGTKIQTKTGANINKDVTYNPPIHMAFNPAGTSMWYLFYDTATGTFRNRAESIRLDSSAFGVLVGIMNVTGEGNACSGVINQGGGTAFLIVSQYGTYDKYAKLQKISVSNPLGTIGTISPTMHRVSGAYFSPMYYNYGTLQPRLIMKGFYMGLPVFSGTSLMSQYSTEYNLTIGTFNVGLGDKISDVLQQLAQASNFVQYIDEGGKYYFKRRDAGTTINWNFGTSDIFNINLVEGDGVSNAPIYNKAVWGTNTGTVLYENSASQGTYGVVAYQLQNKWLTDANIANDVCFGIVNEFAYPRKVLTAEMRWLPLVKLFDVVTLDYSKQGLNNTKKWQVIGISETQEQYKTTFTLKESLA